MIRADQKFPGAGKNGSTLARFALSEAKPPYLRGNILVLHVLALAQRVTGTGAVKTPARRRSPSAQIRSGADTETTRFLRREKRAQLTK